MKICRAGYRDARRRCVAGVTLPEIRDPAPGLSKRDTPKAKVEIGTRRAALDTGGTAAAKPTRAAALR